MGDVQGSLLVGKQEDLHSEKEKRQQSDLKGVEVIYDPPGVRSALRSAPRARGL